MLLLLDLGAAEEGALKTDERRPPGSSSESTILAISCLRALFFGKEAYNMAMICILVLTLRENPDEMVASFGVLPRFFVAGVILVAVSDFSAD